MGTSRFRASDGALWAACAAAALVPWTLGPGLRDAWVLPKCAAAGAFAVWGLAAWAAGGAPSLGLGIEAPLAAFLAAVLLSALVAFDPLGAWLGPEYEPMAGVLGPVATAAGLYLGAAAARTRADASLFFARAFAAAAAPMGLFAVFQACSDVEFGWLGRGVGNLDRAIGTFGHPVALGAFLAVAAPFCLSRALSEAGRAARGAGAFSLAAVAAGLVASGGRSAWAAAATGCALVLLLEGRSWSRRAIAVAAAVCLAVLLTLSLRLVAAGQRSSGRPLAWKIAWGAFLDRPALGWGPGSFSLLYRRDRGAAGVVSEGPLVVFPHAHNDWFEVLAATGFLGAASYAWLHFAAFGAARRVWIPASAAGLGGALALIVQSKVNFPPVAAAFVAAVGFGAALAAAPAPLAGRVPAGLLFAVVALAALALPLSRFPAERASHLGRLAQSGGLPLEAVERFTTAIAGAPGAVRFRSDLTGLLWGIADGAPPSDRDELLLAARDAALQGAVARPAEPEMLRLLGQAELRRAAAGSPSLPAARAALDAAHAADPFNPVILEAQRAVSALESRQGRRQP